MTFITKISLFQAVSRFLKHLMNPNPHRRFMYAHCKNFSFRGMKVNYNEIALYINNSKNKKYYTKNAKMLITPRMQT